jgi:hypothetical protein
MQSRHEFVNDVRLREARLSVFRRDELLQCTNARYAGGAKLFANLDAYRARVLILEGYLDGGDRVLHDAPRAESLVRFVERWHRGATLSGYAARWRKGTGAVKITGLHLALYCISPSECDQAAWEFQVLSEGCDELLVRDDCLNAWWDQ